MPRIENQVSVINKLGLHARAAIKLVQLVANFQAKITLCNGEKQASADSVVGLLMLEAAQGETIRVICDGPEAIEVMDAVQHLFETRFDETE
ncbi:MAG: HPr family phosphocarrier protein [Tolumonas sp.]|jgi:phosphocarrier protein NPr|nr:MAG: HPr family phosphocarrier protein [Tolumonas sp.]